MLETPSIDRSQSELSDCASLRSTALPPARLLVRLQPNTAPGTQHPSIDTTLHDLHDCTIDLKWLMALMDFDLNTENDKEMDNGYALRGRSGLREGVMSRVDPKALEDPCLLP